MSQGILRPTGTLTYSDGAQLDAFGRVRMSNPTTIFEGHQEFTYGPLTWEHYTSGGGTATYNQAGACTLLSTGATTIGNRALRQSKVYHRYQPGKSQYIKITGILNSAGTYSGSAVSSLGYYDDNNGLYFGKDVGGLFICIRSDTSGVVVDTKIYQSNWNIDKFDGTGVSGVTIDPMKVQVFTIDLAWLGTSRVRFGFVIGGVLYYCHQNLTSNVGTTVYMRTANLPIRYEVNNPVSLGSNIQMTAICSSVESEGGVEQEPSYLFRADTFRTPVNCANTVAMTPIISVRLVNTFGGITYRGQVKIRDLVLSVASQAIYWQLTLNPTLTGATFANSADATYSGAEYDLAATATTGGIVIASGYAAAGSVANRDVSSKVISDKIILARTYAGTRDIISLSACGLGGVASVYAGMTLSETY